MIVISCIKPPEIPSARTLEFRADLAPNPDPRAFIRKAGDNVIYACRRKTDGGAWNGSEKQRINLLEKALEAGARFIDVEEDVLEKGMPKSVDPDRILGSYHDVSSTPENIGGILNNLESLPCSHVKIAVTPVSHADCGRLLSLYAEARKPAVFIAMGETGFPTRILGRKLGAAWTYASAPGEPPAAPGMPAADALEDVYRYENIGPSTRVFGVAGNPVSGSAGPAVFNRAFETENIDAVYIPFRAESLAEIVQTYGPFGLEGLSVTRPLKNEVPGVADGGVDETTAALKSGNTLHWKGGGWTGRSFDGIAARAAVESAVGGAAGKHVFVLGAGGAAVAAAFEFVRGGYEVAMSARNAGRAAEAAGLAGCGVVPWADRAGAGADVIVNATPVGMYDNPDGSPIDAAAFRPGMVAFDMIYNPARTKFLDEAAAAGARVVGGWEMYRRQAAEQFRLWTGVETEIPASGGETWYGVR